MRIQWTCLLAAAITFGVNSWCMAQDRNRESDEDRNQTQRNAESRSNSDESWSEWFSDWWKDDQESHRMSGNRKNQNQYHGLQGFFRRHDDNEDGYLSRSELPKRMRSGFESLDRDQDNYLSQEELKRHVDSMQQQHTPIAVTYIWVLDADQGRVRLQDLQEAYELLSKIDQNEDGEITKSELRQRQQQVASKWIDQCFNKHDENDDGKIDRDEAKGTTLAQRFDRVDQNSDDKLTRDEMMKSVKRSLGNQPQSDQSQENAMSRNRSDESETRSANREQND